MGTSIFGEPTSRSGSSRKGKKSNSDKPKKPQRGLGVAQLEKIRLQGQVGIHYYPGKIPSPYPTSFDQYDVRVQKGHPSMPSSAIYMPSSSLSVPYGFYPGFMMAVGEHERTNNYFGHHQPTHRPSWYSSNGIIEAQHSQPVMTRPFLNTHPEDLEQKRSTNHFNCPNGSNSQTSRSKDTQDIDLELKLSL